MKYEPRNLSMEGGGTSRANLGFEDRNKDRKSIGTVILPIPGGIQDQQQVSWGQDTMDAAAPVVVNNTTPPAPAPASDNKMAVAIGSPGVRNNFSTIERYYDRRMV